MQVSSVVFP
ncbi:unnamed protein product [Linum tenue]|uniref:Uncharacterized protein n=1 Tax=Linum tenue TaxID=586396 RepID=A0AAV0MFY1_9ROSI|nr:unnamed protein product [Linum tenue]CAI0390644.1 unnamed protein product [Linum tenue]CAI0392011.1 unnamed protein product [Linum tenue]CAI0423519.1 unnamed protein product [Linum tenue]CAI0425643.1 unnamed protein product [Linum tenue]